MKGLIKYGLLILGLQLTNCLCSQEDKLNENLGQLIESIAEEAEGEIDFSYLVDQLNELAADPVNVNSDEINKLAALQLISNIQLNNLVRYIRSYGQIQTVYEMQMIDGWDVETIRKLAPFITFKQEKRKPSLKAKDIANWGKHKLLFRYSRAIEKAAGYKSIADSSWEQKPGSHYLGAPDRIYLKYKFDYAHKLHLGFLAEKDPGEVFLLNKIPDSIKKLTEGKLKNGFDFYSAYFYLEEIGPLKKIIVGDFHPGFGQGLTLWSGFSMGKTANATDIKKYAFGIRPNTSVDENGFFRGLATAFSFHRFSFTAFYANNKVDANISVLDTLGEQALEISSLQETGYHRTINELLDKNSTGRMIFGANINFKGNNFSLGFTACKLDLSAKLENSTALYQHFAFAGKENTNIGLNYDWMIGKVNLFGEISRSQNGGMAALAGLLAPLCSRIDLALLYRNYAKDFQNLNSLAFSESSSSVNEKGFYIGLSTQINRQIRFSAYADIFTFPWLRFRLDRPSWGKEYFFQFDYRKENYSFFIRYKFKQKEINDSNEHAYVNGCYPYQKQNLKFDVKYLLNEHWELGNRLEISEYTFKGNKEPGYLLYQNLAYHALDGKLDLHFRYALFDARDYNARLYAYENDVLYAFSIPSYYGKGSRAYLMFNYKITEKTEIWLRYAITSFSDRQLISSGLGEIEGNHKSEIKAQLQIKF
jgi:hypothetical protein